MKKTQQNYQSALFGLALVLILLLLAGCGDLMNENEKIVAVTNISGIPDTVIGNNALNLFGTVLPENATNKTIVWLLTDSGNTGATIFGNSLSFSREGTITITATIANGKSQGIPYTQNFEITVYPFFSAVTGITNVPTAAVVGIPLILTGTITPNYTTRIITWSLKNPGTTGAVIEVNPISGNDNLVTDSEGKAIVTATIVNGIAPNMDYTEDFEITVNATSGTFTDISALGDYLAYCDINTKENPIPVKLEMDLDSSWQGIINILYRRISFPYTDLSRYVELDLSDSTGMSTFNPLAGITNSMGMNYIVILILPDTTTAITGSTSASTAPFRSFTSLREIRGSGVKTIGDYTFHYGGQYAGTRPLANLQTVVFPVLESVGNYAFFGCIGLPEITILDNVTTIGNYAFMGCTGLTSVTIPDNSVTTIGDYAFEGCTELTSVTIGNSVTTVGARAFAECTGLTSVTIGNRVATIGASAFYNCTELTSVTIPDSVTSIGTSAFYRCTGLTSITIPNSITSIEEQVFYNCTGLASIIIPNSVTSIGISAFSGSRNLTVTIPDSVTSIRSRAFSGSSGLTVTMKAISRGSWEYSYEPFLNCQNLTVYLQANDTGSWPGVFMFGNADFTVTLTGSGTSIGSSAFSNCTGLTSITIPNSVTSIGAVAFSGCYKLTSITIPNITSIGSNVFSYCTGLTNITIPGSVTSIGTSAFSGCTGLSDITIPGSVTSIGSSAFSDCTGLTNITIPGGVTSIGSSAFSGCTILVSVTFNGNILSANFSSTSPFPGNLRTVYFAAGGGIGTYITQNPGANPTWTKE